MTHSRTEAGFTILEAVIAGVVLTLGIIGAFAAASNMLLLSRDAHDLATAAADLTGACELVNSVAFQDLTAKFPAGQAIPQFNGKSLSGESVVVTYPTPGTDPLPIDLTITWTAADNRQETALAAVVRTR